MKKKIKTFIALMAVLSLGISTAGHVSFAAVDNGTEIPTDNIEILYDVESIRIDESGMARRDNVIYFTTTYSSDTSKWWECEMNGNEALFDFSWLNSASNEKVYICGDVNKRVTSVDVKWKELFNVTFTGSLQATDITDSEEWQNVYRHYPNFGDDTGYCIFQKRVNGKLTTYLDLENIEWRKGNEGLWRDYDELDLHEMQIRGGQLQFRIKADNGSGNDGYRFSSIGKLTVNKIQTGPSVSVANTTATVSLRNGYEFSRDRVHWILIPTYNSRGTTDALFVEETDREGAIQTITTTQKVSRLSVQEALGIRTSDPVPETVLYVRNASTDRAAAAKITTLRIPASMPVNSSEVQSGIKLNYCLNKTATGGIELVNDLDDTYQVVVVSPTEQTRYGIDINDQNTLRDIPVSNLTWTTVRANSSTKVTYKKAPTGSIILVRKAGDESNLASPYVIYNRTVDNTTALTYASTSGAARKLCQLQAIPSTNISKTDPGLTYRWQYCDAKSAPDNEWTDFATTRVITIDGDIYTNTLGKYIRVLITYNGVTVKSVAVGTVK